MDAIIKITSVVLGRDVHGEGAHTMKTSRPIGAEHRAAAQSVTQLTIHRKWSTTTQNLAEIVWSLTTPG
jgi:hypothetical protein